MSRVTTDIRQFLVLFCSLFLAYSCGIKDDLDDMGSRTENMLNTTNIMYHQMRSKEGQETRERNLKALKKAETFEEKLTYAAAYLNGFEFQLWSNGLSPRDTNRYRNELLRMAAAEFFRAMQTMYQNIGKEDGRELSPATSKNDALSLFAISVLLHEVHAVQSELAADGSFRERNMLNMIKDALENEQKMLVGKPVNIPEWQEEILFAPFRETAITLLHMRKSMLMGMSLNTISDIGDRRFIGRARYLLRAWNSNFMQQNISTQRKVVEFLEEAYETKKFLEEIGEPASLHRQIRRVYRRMRTVEVNGCYHNCPGDDVEPSMTRLTESEYLLDRKQNYIQAIIKKD